MAAIILLKAHINGYTRHDGTVVKPHDDKRQAARIVTRPDGVRYNPDLPRGTLPKYDHPEIQASLKRKTEALARVSAAWNDATEKLVAKYLPKIEAAGIKGEMAKKAARTMASMHPMDTETSPEFSEHRAASAEAIRISDEHHDVVAAHYGEPEFESMRQPGQFDRPQTRTPEFKKWFGGSKVVNAKGEPLIVMHGSNKDFSEFRGSDRQQPDQANNNWFGELGSWFAAPSSSGSYEEGNAEATADVFAELRGDDKGDNAGVVYPVYLAIKNPAEFDSYEELTDERDAAGGAAKFRAKMIAAGHDGIVLRDSDTDGGQYRDDWVAFHPHQIKSAMGNNGQFNPADADMTKSAGPVLLLAKANVKAHARRLPSGKVVQVAAHTDRRHTTLAPGQMALFTRHGAPW